MRVGVAREVAATPGCRRLPCVCPDCGVVVRCVQLSMVVRLLVW